jgi:hypothetical protein
MLEMAMVEVVMEMEMEMEKATAKVPLSNPSHSQIPQPLYCGSGYKI